jgi:hypothetical protein
MMQARDLTWCSWFERNNPDFFDLAFPFRAVKINQVPIFNASSTDNPGSLYSRGTSVTTHFLKNQAAMCQKELNYRETKKNRESHMSY